MSSRPWATRNHAIAARARGQPRTLDGRRLRERTATSFSGSCRCNPSRFGASRNRIHRRKRGRGRPSASKTGASKAEIASPRFLRAEQGAFVVTDCKAIDDRLQDPLEGAGVEFTNGDQPGVRLTKVAAARSVEPARALKPTFAGKAVRSKNAKAAKKKHSFRAV